MTVALFQKKNGLYQSIEISGHAGYAAYGNDIVCAGISSATILCINLLDKFIPLKFSVVENSQKGLIRVDKIDYAHLNEDEISIITKIISCLYESLNQIAQDYPNNFKLKLENNN